MLTGTFEDTLVAYIEDEDIESANRALMTELGNVLVRNKQNFVDMLNESGVEADNSMSNRQLIELFIDNTDNKNLLVGASLLTQIHNKQLGFDGEDYISDDGVKSGVAVMDAYFNGVLPDEEYSYIAPFLIKPLIGGIKKLFGRKNQEKVSQGYNALAERQMRQQVALRKKLEAERRKRLLSEQKAKQKMNTMIIIGGAVVLTVIVGIIIYTKGRK